ncbi:MAG: hypothetical protein HOY71_16455 [Nonomuraea sp.]|nr:hypothetical protein [Nonomuraea sp.]
MGPKLRKTVLVVHIGASVALLGEVWSLVVLNTVTTTGAAEGARGAYALMANLIFTGGVPLSMISLVTGIVLGLTSRWGLFRHLWVVAKLGLLLGVICAGMFLFDPAGMALGPLPAPGRQWAQVAVVGAQAVMLATATALSVFKPGRRRAAA